MVLALSSSSYGADKVKFVPIQSIAYEFGSKLMSGYFVRQSDSCFLVMMVTEKVDPEHAPPLVSSIRVRLALSPGEIAGLDSEEGRSLNITCSEGANAVYVESGDTDSLTHEQEGTNLVQNH